MTYQGHLSLVTAPAEEPLTRDEAKAHIRVDLDDENTLIDGLITAAREHVETVTRRALLTQTYDLYLDDWPCPRPGRPGWPWEELEIKLPRPPLQSVEGIFYTPDGGQEQELASSEYEVDAVGEPGRVVITGTLPADELKAVNGVRINFVAGWESAEDVPQTIKQAMLLLLGDFYENREDSVLIQGLEMQQLPYGVQALLATHRVWP